MVAGWQETASNQEDEQAYDDDDDEGKKKKNHLGSIKQMDGAVAGSLLLLWLRSKKDTCMESPCQ